MGSHSPSVNSNTHEPAARCEPKLDCLPTRCDFLRDYIVINGADLDYEISGLSRCAREFCLHSGLGELVVVQSDVAQQGPLQIEC